MKKAYSLIEVSIVVLIVGILITFVVQGSSVIKRIRLASARSMSANSPVVSMSGLALWLDATSETAFLDTQSDNNFQLTQWKDSNPQTASKNNASRATSTSAILYKSSGINYLPSVYFDGTASVNSNLVGGPLLTKNNSFTAFIVYQSLDITSSSWRGAFVSTGASSGGWGLQKNGSSPPKRDFVFGGVTDSYSTSTLTLDPEIVVLSYNGTTKTMYINGVAETITNSSSAFTTQLTRYIVGNTSTSGGASTWNGYIGEIIVFERALGSDDRKAVESYLGKKWRIEVTP